MSQGIEGSAAGVIAAPPLGALAGGLDMAGPVAHAGRSPAAEAKDRRQRARRSAVVQATVIVSAFALSHVQPS